MKKVEGQNIRFLVVDDDVQVRKSVIEYLITFGYLDYREAGTGVEALAILQKEKIDFVISDWEMPGISGLDLLRALRADDKLKRIPFIMVTSPISKERFKIEEAAISQVDAYIIKPFRARVLREKIEELMPHINAEKAISSRETVLVVDDDAGVRQTMVEYLKEMGYPKVALATNGVEGFALAKEKHAELAFILSDWDMPQMAGIDLLKHIREDEDLKDIPFIMITSQASIERIKIKRAIEAEVNHYLLKPVRMKDLQAKIDEVRDCAKVDLEANTELNAGEEALAKQNYRDAEKSFQRVVKLRPQSSQAYVGLAQVQLRRMPDSDQAVELAIQYLKKGSDVNPRNEDCHLELAACFEAGRSLDKAILCMQEGLVHCPLSERMYYQLGRLLLMRARKDEGAKHLARALELKPDFQEAKDLLAEVKSRKKGRR